MNLYDNQIKGIEKLKEYKVGALFMEPGTGKTLTAYELVKSVPDCDYILWLTPFQTKKNLKDELERCGGLDCEIIGIETLSSSDRIYLDLRSKLEKSNNPFIICDESLKIKNWTAKRTQRIIELGKLAKYKLILNGTPLSKNIMDIWAQMEFLSPKILNMSYSRFKNTFCEYTIIRKSIGQRWYQKEFLNKYHNIDYLYSLLQFYVYEANLELDTKKQYIDCKYSIDSEMREEYARIKEKYLSDETLIWKNNNIFLEITQMLQHSYSLSSEKFEIVDNIRKSIPENKILIYCKYLDSVDALKKKYPQMKILTYGKHAFGLNLQDYNATIFFDKTWDYAIKLQSEQRTYRIGQTENCYYYDLTGNVGLEDLINSNIERKTNLLDYFKTKSVKELQKEL